MAILVANDGSKFVDTIAQRDAIEKRFNGMRVIVRDATADPFFGGGSVQYIWDTTIDGWNPIWSENKPDLRFATEEKVLASGQVTAENLVKDGVVWSVKVLDDDDSILSDAKVTITGRTLDIGSTTFDGKRLHYTYAFGAMNTVVADLWESKADKASPEFEGTPKAPTPAANADVKQIVNVEYLNSKLDDVQAGIAEAPTDGKEYVRKEAAWAELVKLEEAPEDDANYVRRNGEWAEVNILPDAPNDSKNYVRKDNAWSELQIAFDHYDLKATAAAATGNVNYDYTASQVITLNLTAGTRNVALASAPAGRSVTGVIVVLGKNVPTFTGTNVVWNNNETPTADDFGATRTVLIAFWDSIDKWIITRGPRF